MKIIWLGQSGLLFVSGNKKIVVDPYLSDSLKKIDKRMYRGMKLNKKFFKVKPDIIVLTNSHPDHTDITTLTSYLRKSKKPVTLLCSEASYAKVEDAKIRGRYNNVMFCEGSEWTLENLRITAVKAQTDDKTAIGITVSDAQTGKVYYVAGDTLYNKYVIESVPKSPDVSFIPINGEDGCMNMADAARFAFAIDSQITVPVHFGMFDLVDPREFHVRNKMIPKIYRILDFDSMDCKKNPFRRAGGLTHKFDEAKPKKPKSKILSTEDENEAVKAKELAEAQKKKELAEAPRTYALPVAKAHEPSDEEPENVSDISDTTYEDNVGQDDENEFYENESATDASFDEDDVQSDGENAPYEDEINVVSDEEDSVEESPEDEEVFENPYYEDPEPDDYPNYANGETDDFSEDDINEENLSEKIDAYIKEFEKFERGDTVDFEKIDYPERR